MAEFEHRWHVHVSWDARYHLTVAGKHVGDNGMCAYAMPPIVRSSRDTAMLAARAAVSEIATLHRDAYDIEAVVYRVVVDAETQRVVTTEQRYTVTMHGEFPTQKYNGPKQTVMVDPDRFIESTTTRSNP